MGKDSNDDEKNDPDSAGKHNIERDGQTGMTSDDINPADYANPFDEGTAE